MLRCEYDVIFAHPLCMCQVIILIRHKLQCPQQAKAHTKMSRHRCDDSSFNTILFYLLFLKTINTASAVATAKTAGNAAPASSSPVLAAALPSALLLPSSLATL